MGSMQWAWVKAVGGLLILGLLVWRVGTAPFRAGLEALDGRALLLGALIAVVTTVASAWRWTVVARALGTALPLPTAVAAYYRSQFLNTVLPGGVLGDVHRGVSHGQQVGRLATGVRAVVWERVLGLVVLVALALSAASVVLAGAVLLLLGLAGWGRRRLGVPALSLGAWSAVLIASLVAISGYVLTFAVATQTVGVDLDAATLIPIVLLVLLASSVPVNVGGWGPREGAAAWAFGLAGVSASLGVTVSVAYAVMGLVSTLPGGVVLVLSHLQSRPVADVPVPGGGAR